MNTTKAPITEKLSTATSKDVSVSAFSQTVSGNKPSGNDFSTTGNDFNTTGNDFSTTANTITVYPQSTDKVFLNMETSTLILIGGLAALVIIVLVVVLIVVIYIRCKSKSRRQVNVAPEHRGEPEAVSGDTVPLT